MGGTTTLVTADLHLADSARDAYRFVFFEQTLPRLIEEHGAARLLVLGDLTESKAGHSPGLVNRIVDGFAALAEEVDVCVLKGNHDFLAEDVPFYRFLRHLDRVRWINEPTAIKLRGLGDCLFLPYTKNLDEWSDLLPQVEDWTFCHQTFKNADMGHGFLAEGAAAAPFAKNARVVSGDVHVPQKIGPVTYVGSPYRVDFGDEFEPRVLLLDGGKMRSVSVEGPQKRLVLIDAPTDLYSVAGVSRGDVVKVRVELQAGSDLSRASIRAAAQAWADEAGVVLHAVQVVQPETARADRAAARAGPQRPDADLIRAYARKMGKGRATEAAGLKIAEETS